MKKTLEFFQTHRYVRLLLILLVAILLPFIFTNNYYRYILCLICIYSVMTLSLNLLMGIGGQTSLGNAAFACIGAYTTALLLTRVGLPFYLCIICSGLVSAAIGFVIGLPSVRLSGHYLAVATMGFGVAVPQIALQWEKLTNGAMGINIKAVTIFGLKLNNDFRLYFLNLLILVIVYLLINNVIRTRFGRKFSAIRDSETAAQAMGIRLLTSKTLLFATSAFFTGIAGAMYAISIRYVGPNDFPLITSYNLITMIVLGGLNSSVGAVIGAAAFVILNQLTKQVLGASELISGAVMLVIVLFFQDGIIGIVRMLKEKLQKLKKIKGGETSDT